MGVLSRRNPAMSDLVIQADAFAAAAHAAIDHRRKYTGEPLLSGFINSRRVSVQLS